MKSWPIILALGISAIIGVGILGINNAAEAPTNTGAKAGGAPGAPGAPALRLHWQEQISALGPAGAYDKFKREYSKVHFSAQHLAAHVMGELIYETVGLPGLAICDPAFAFGCYHSFFGRAIAEKGEDIVKELDRQCVSRLGPGYTGCQHGIGHGLMEYFGSRRLAEALRECERTTVIHPLLGCTSGVFMEYNTPIVIGEQTSQSLRELSPDPLDPCPSLQENFRPSCYFELAAWWHNYVDYGEMGRLCARLDAASVREACFLGIGYIVVPFNEYRIKPSKTDCQKMPTSDGGVLCRAGAWWSYFAVPEQRSLADDMCADLTALERSRCLEKGMFVR